MSSEQPTQTPNAGPSLEARITKPETTTAGSWPFFVMRFG